MPARPPETIRQYRVEDKLGEGSSGAVYRAFDTHLERAVVVKVLHRQGGADGTERLLEEARLASAIEHPNVCAVYEAGEADGRPYLVMQYVPGRTLQDLLAGGGLAEPLALSLGVQVAAGLAAAHRHGVLHRDLKPSNVIVTDDGVAKILDFGLARRSGGPGLDAPPRPGRAGTVDSSRFGTTAYMAPEQFVMRRSTEQSDVWALGVVLFQMATGQHPFWVPALDTNRLIEAVQSLPVPSPVALRPGLDPAFAEVVLRALAKQPADRYGGAAEVRDALRTLARARDAAFAAPGEAAVPAPPAEGERAAGGLFSAIADRLLPARSGAAAPANALAVVPFRDDGSEPAPPYVGFALADAVAARLAEAPGLIVRPPRALRATAGADAAAGPVEAGRLLAAAWVLTGQFARADGGLHLAWRLLSVEDDAVVVGRTLRVETDDLVAAQDRLGDAVWTALQASGALPIAAPPTLRPAAAVDEADLPDDLAEDYLEARALLDSQARRSSPRADLDGARGAFGRVLERAPDFAPAHAGLGLALVRAVRYGYEGVGALLVAQRHLERALALDPSNIEATVYRAYTRLWRGEKERVRQDVQYLLQTAGADAEVHVGAGVVLHRDGLLDESVAAFSAALRLNPALGPRVYNLRARVHLYRQRPGPARRDLDRGLALEPAHTLLRVTDAVWHLRHGSPDRALAGLEGVVADNPDLRLAWPTLALARLRAGDADGATALMTDELLAQAAADGEMAYRVATFFAAAGDADEAHHWLRKTVYLGNHNAPWFLANPDWAAVREHAGVRQTLAEVARTQRRLRERWRRVLADR